MVRCRVGIDYFPFFLAAAFFAAGLAAFFAADFLAAGALLALFLAAFFAATFLAGAASAFGAFFVPKAYGTSITMTGGVQAALWGFLAFYVTCLAATWWFYTRRGGLLYDVEHRVALPPSAPRPPAAAQPAE